MKTKNNPASFYLLANLLCVLLFAACAKVVPPKAVGPVPNQRQMAWQEMEQYAFIHFTTNTFTDKEWGFGDETPQIFNPTALDAEQWVKVIKEAGLKGLIFTCKHHDGFCLWPSKYTEHTVKNSPYKNGQGDVVKEVADACRKHGIKFGMYLSPWDRNHAAYGQQEYVEYYQQQIQELFTAYGPAFEMWFDGANGGDGYYGGKNTKIKIDGASYYKWPQTRALVRELDKNVILFSDAGPDIRWCGNEKGYMGETNWSTIDTDTLYPGKYYINDLLNVGSENGKEWVPAETNVSIRPGWFYHAHEDDKVRSPEDLFQIYMQSVGRGTTFLLNIPPDRRGLLHENDVKSLQGYKRLLDEAFKTNLAAKALVTVSAYRGKAKQYGAKNLTDGNKETYWTTDDAMTTGSLEIDLGKPQPVKYVMLQEYIKLGQRVRAFEVEAWENNSWKKVAGATTIGYKRILKVEPVTTQRIRVNISDAKACPLISNVEVY
jgi:alpha-L-fucosidase